MTHKNCEKSVNFFSQPDQSLNNKDFHNLGHTMLVRSWFKNCIYPLLFLLSLVLSLSTYLSLDSLQQSIHDYVDQNQKQIVGGDIVLTSKQSWNSQILDEVSKVKKSNIVYDYQFNAMVTPNASSKNFSSLSVNKTAENSILTSVKAVSSSYPLYGEVRL